MKKLRDDVILNRENTIPDLLDNILKSAYNVTDGEYDYIAGEMTDKELDTFMGILVSDPSSISTSNTFSKRREALEIRNKYLKQYNVLKANSS